MGNRRRSRALIARRIIAGVLALAIAGAAWAGRGWVRSPAEHALDERLRRDVHASSIDAADALASAHRALIARAAAVATVPSLANALTTLDRETIAEQLNLEPPLAPYRKEMPILAVLLSPTEGATRGVNIQDLPAADLFADAESQGAASRLVVIRGTPYLLAAEPRLIHPPDGSAARNVLVLAGQELAGPALERIARREQGAVALSDGRGLLATSGTPAMVARLQNLPGFESKGEHIDLNHRWSAAAQSVAPGLWLWTGLDTSTQAEGALAPLRTVERAIDCGAGALSLVVLLLGFRRPREDGGFNATTLSARSATGAFYSGSTPATPIQLATPAGAMGTPFGRYVLVDQLASGGMGDVYLAVAFGAEGFRRSFVIKRLRPELARAPELVAHFINEARLSSSLVHSNIVPTFEFGKVGDEFFMAQEYIDGRDLERLTQASLERDGRPLPPNLVFYAAHQVLRALAYAHAKTDDAGAPLKLVHRDVSPQNVLVSSRGEVKLFDFGIVKTESKSTKTEAGVVKGNVSYMSPEQAQGNPVDARSDLYSLGLLMYRCLTGEMLFRDETPYKLLVHAARGPSPEDLQRIAALPAPIPALLARMLSVEAAQRYQNAHDLAAALPPENPSDAEEMAALVQRLFGDKLAEERTKLVAVAPAQVEKVTREVAS